MQQNKQIKNIFVDRQVKNLPQVERILSQLQPLPVQVVDTVEEIKEDLCLSPDPIAESKKVLFLTREKSVIRPCPCTQGCVCCHYWTLDLNLNCPLDCSYCILQAYLNLQPLTLAVNQEDLQVELDTFFSRQNGEVLRIGTGELGDSLALDSISGQASLLAGLVGGRKRVWLELKTKTAGIDSLMAMPAPENVVLAWSLNSKRIINSEEGGSANFEERLRAAFRAVEQGYRVAFHLDPIIYYSDWEREYEDIIVELLKKIPGEALAWVSLGTLRFPAKLREIARWRFPQSMIYEGEFIRSWDGKFRYPRPLRLKLYEKFKKIFQEYGLSHKLYLCMESSEVWREFLGQNKKGKLYTSPFCWLD
ncbi:MAG TPA: hypothetical protein PLP57_08545 [Candidatus Saccharicenans sp.]|jgi:spore photoproduct lyase|nr:hypothetical protein [Candidatus Saccharicenans sp.]HRD02673.1 hypothetical protein [Candidatus Saccharicenans sp.]